MDDFEALRPLLFGIAYRMLSSVADAEDIVQDAYIRYTGAPRESIRSPRSFLATIVSFDLVTVNAGPGVILREAGKPIVVMSSTSRTDLRCTPGGQPGQAPPRRHSSKVTLA